MTILYTYQGDNPESALFFGVVTAILALFALLAVIFTAIEEKEWAVDATFVAVLLLAAAYFSLFVIYPKEKNTVYVQAIIDENASFTEIMEKYEPVRREEQIWTMKVREKNEDSQQKEAE